MHIVAIVVVIYLIYVVSIKIADGYVAKQKNKRIMIDPTIRLPMLRKMLNKINNKFVEKKIPLWLDYGTLLGFHRNSDLICYDDDLDFGALMEDKERIILALAELENENSDLLVKDTCKYGRCKYVVMDKVTGLPADIDLYYRDDKRLKPEFLSHLYRKFMDMPLSDYFPLKTKQFLGSTVSVPNNVEKVLLDKYGSSYMTPNLVCDDSCKNCKEVDN